MPLVRTARLSLFTERAGAGEQVLFISGTGSDLRDMPIANLPLTREFDVLAYDQRGLGQSDKPDGAYTMVDYADDAAALLDAIGWKSAHVIGYSFGGMVAQHLAIRHPTRVERLVLGATSPGGAGGSSFPLHELQKLPTEERLRKMIDVSFGDVPDEMLKPMLAMMSAREAQRDPASAAGAVKQIEARAHHDAWERLPLILSDTLICAGLKDRMAPPSNARALANRIPNAQLRWYQGGHVFFMTETAAFMDDVAAFLRGDDLTPNGLEANDHG